MRVLVGLAGALLLAGAAAEPGRIASPHSLSRDLAPGERYMGVALEGALRLAPATVDGHVLGGLSALGFDADENVVYALSDGGVVFHLQPHHDESGYLVDVEVPRAFALLDARGRPLTGRHADSEGLTLRNAGNGVRGDTELVVSFERVPRVVRYDTAGRVVGGVALPERLREVRNYRTSNRGLESLAWHPRYGYLVAMEQPMRDADDGAVELHALESGRRWRYPLAAEPNAALTDVAVLGDGSLLTLERGYGVLFIPFITTLRRVPALPAQDGATLEVETVARLNTGQGWALDNFEGIAVLGDDRVLLVSDDNRQALQSTLLAQFRLLGPARADAPGTRGDRGARSVLQ